MGVIALYTGLILWRLYVRLDSVKYPLKSYADIAERIFGKPARHVCTILQSLQLIVNVGPRLNLSLAILFSPSLFRSVPLFYPMAKPSLKSAKVAYVVLKTARFNILTHIWRE